MFDDSFENRITFGDRLVLTVFEFEFFSGVKIDELEINFKGRNRV